jgi:MoaA/NifB/PqqE/SkfB family radical SAM enzyme
MRPVTLLWALRSPCNLGCRYCYFGTIEEHRAAPATGPGMLSHLARTDLTRDEVFAFAAGLRGSAVGRVFLAGGEPLIWPPVLDLIAVLKDAGIEVVIATNGIPLNRPHITAALVDLGVDAVSVSLDSTDPDYNDTWRPARNASDGWDQVISGLRALLAARGRLPGPRVGIYAVITRRNLDAVTAVPALAARLGCDYAVPQPIALDAAHPLHGELTLRPGDLPGLTDAFAQLYARGLPLQLPEPNYPRQVAATVGESTGVVRGCFGGHTLHFIEPDGSIWDCPSSLRIAATPPAARGSVRDGPAADLFGQPRGCAADCALFSGDCVNMWPLMGFDSFLHPAGAASAGSRVPQPTTGPV